MLILLSVRYLHTVVNITFKFSINMVLVHYIKWFSTEVRLLVFIVNTEIYKGNYFHSNLEIPIKN